MVTPLVTSRRRGPPRAARIDPLAHAVAARACRYVRVLAAPPAVEVALGPEQTNIRVYGTPRGARRVASDWRCTTRARFPAAPAMGTRRPQGGEHRRRTMRLGRWRLLATSATAALFLMIGGASAASAQGTITGRVVDQTSNAPISDAHVMVVGSPSSVTTGQDGRYTLNDVAAGVRDVRVLRVGFEARKLTVTVVAGQTATLNFALAPTIVKLQDMVTTATGEQRKVELGNAI